MDNYPAGGTEVYPEQPNRDKPNGIRVDTDYHLKIENHPLYKKLKELFFNTVEEHTCAADEGQSYTEEEDGIFVAGTHEAAYFIATWAFQHIKEAWEDGWRVRNNSCGISKSEALIKKHKKYEAFKSGLMNEIDKLNPPEK